PPPRTRPQGVVKLASAQKKRAQLFAVIGLLAVCQPAIEDPGVRQIDPAERVRGRSDDGTDPGERGQSAAECEQPEPRVVGAAGKGLEFPDAGHRLGRERRTMPGRIPGINPGASAWDRQARALTRW